MAPTSTQKGPGLLSAQQPMTEEERCHGLAMLYSQQGEPSNPDNGFSPLKMLLKHKREECNCCTSTGSLENSCLGFPFEQSLLISWKFQ